MWSKRWSKKVVKNRVFGVSPKSQKPDSPNLQNPGTPKICHFWGSLDFTPFLGFCQISSLPYLKGPKCRKMSQFMGFWRIREKGVKKWSKRGKNGVKNDPFWRVLEKPVFCHDIPPSVSTNSSNSSKCRKKGVK